MNWRIYLSDGTVVTGDEGAVPDLCWKSAATIQIILQQHDNDDWFMECGQDFYVWDSRGDQRPRWWGVDFAGKEVYMLQPGWKKVLVGERVPAEVYDPMYKRVVEDMQRLRNAK